VRRHDGALVVSATDLVGFLECEHLTSLEIEAELGLRVRPIRDDPELKLIRERGLEHEQNYLARLRADGRVVEDLSGEELKATDQLRHAADATLAVMRAGADVIFQATFFDGRWRGHADFLLRRDDRASDLGSWSYDIADTKLAKRVKAAAILQMCVYADLLEKVQGIPPETVSVVTGDGVARPHRLADYAAYYRSVKARFEARLFDGQPAPETYPEPVDHCRVCPWFSHCIEQRRADDHLSIVANVSRSQRRRLVDAGVTTLAALAERPAAEPVPRIPPRILERLRRQAGLQLDRRRSGRLSYQLLAPRQDELQKGLAALPPPSPLDVFFDIEADPWAFEDGIEYLLGYVTIDGPEPAYAAIWGHDRAAEKAAFERFVDMVAERVQRDPGMHVYHYGGYESGALKRLMQRHATREDEVDAMLRGDVLVNLYDHVVRSALLASLESYSIKQLEAFYEHRREGPITEAGFSVVQYEEWLETGDASILDDLAEYNRDDCLSTLGLRDWLEGLRLEAAPLYPDGVVPRPTPEDPNPSETVAREQAETHARENALKDGVPPDRLLRSPEEQGRWLLAGLLDWHRRDAKPAWWLWYELRDAPPGDLVAHPEALGDLTFDRELGRIKQSVIRRYRFDPAQETKLGEGDRPIDPAGNDGKGEGAGEIVGIDPIAGTVDLRCSPARAHPLALIPSKPYGPDPMRPALGRLADQVISHGIAGAGPFRAARDLILRELPRIRGRETGLPLVDPDETPLDAARRIAPLLDGSILPIQGPPGTGKTYTGARMILALVEAGKRVGVTGQSHKVIANLLDEVVKAAGPGRAVRIGQRCDAPADRAGPAVTAVSNDEARDGLAGGRWDVIGGTAWLWARPDMAASVDVLFVDEAGQVSLATVASVAGAADSIVLLGDPNQLPQVSQGVHPEGADASALEHLVGDAKTIPPERGLFLDRTFRLHPLVNDYVSETFYEGRLTTHEDNARQRLAAGSVVGGVGIRDIAIEHVGAANRSRDEAAWIADAIAALIGRPWTDRRGVTRGLTVADVLVVAPYNAQVAEIVRTVESRLGATPNVGTVDKFQGREAPVAIYSMTTSTPEDAPRDFEFLYSGHRLNVAISRAQGLAVLIATPSLLRVACRSPEQMRLVSALCRLAEVAAKQAAEDRAAREPTPPADRTAVAVGGSVAPEELTLGLE
jgi:predicted RecB family nuclease